MPKLRGDVEISSFTCFS